MFYILTRVLRYSSIDRISACQLRSPVPVPGEIKDFNLYPRTECVLCGLSCVVSGGGSENQLTTDSGKPVLLYLSSVLVHSMWSPYRHLTRGHLVFKFWREGVRHAYWGRLND